MQTFSQFIAEQKAFTNWAKPSDADIALEYKIEYSIKPLKAQTNDAFPTLDDFKKALKAAKVITLTPAVDRQIEYRSHTRDKAGIISLIRGYASYPEFRNEKTVDAIYDGFAENKPMKYPFIIEFPNGRRRIMSGNTRVDVAIHSGVVPKALLIKIPKE
jgi:hypothetical protein